MSTTTGNWEFVDFDFSGSDFDLSGIVSGTVDTFKPQPSINGAGNYSELNRTVTAANKAEVENDFQLDDFEIEGLMRGLSPIELTPPVTALRRATPRAAKNQLVEITSVSPTTTRPELSRESRQQLIALQAQITTAVRQQNLRSIALFSVGDTDEASGVAAEVGRMVAGYSDLSVALMRLCPERDLAIAKECELDIRPTLLPNLCDVKSGAKDVGLGSWLRFSGREEAVARLRQHFGLTLMVGPSLTDYPEAALAAVDTNAVILVARKNQTSQSDLIFSCQLLEQAGAPILGVVLSDLPDKGTSNS